MKTPTAQKTVQMVELALLVALVFAIMFKYNHTPEGKK